MSGVDRKTGVILPFILVTLIWSSTWIVILDQLGAVPPSWSVCYRFLVAGVGMWLFALARRVPLRLPPAGIAFAALLGLCQFVLNFNFVYRAEHYLTSGVVATVYALLLIPNCLFAWIAFRQPVSRSFVLGSLVAIAGIAMLLLREYRAAPVTADAVLLGIALSVGGLLSASAANIMQGMEIARRLPMVAVLAWIAFRQPVSRSFILGSLVAIAGIAMLLLREYRAAPVTADAVLLGIALSVGGLLSASAANIMQGMEIARRLPMVAVLAWAMLLGSAMDAAFAWATVGPPVMEWRAGYIFGIAWLGLAGSVVTFPLYFRLIQRIGAGRAAYTSVLIPVIAMLISTLVEGYRWTTLAAFGALLAVAGMAIALRAKAA